MTKTLTHDEVLELDRFAVDVALLQGLWTEAQYLRLSTATNRLLEYVDGTIEVVPMPTEYHQGIVGKLYVLLLAYLSARGGKVFFSPLRLRTAGGRFREPDLLAVRSSSDPRRANDYWRGADLVIEVISPDDPQRDTVQKRTEYARSAITEYWIIDPRDETILVLALAEDAYTEYGHFGRGGVATSPGFEGLLVPVDHVFDAH